MIRISFAIHDVDEREVIDSGDADLLIFMCPTCPNAHFAFMTESGVQVSLSLDDETRASIVAALQSPMTHEEARAYHSSTRN